MNVTLMVHVSVGARGFGVTGQVVALIAKSAAFVPPMEAAPSTRFAAPRLLTVTLCDALVVRYACVANVRLVGLTPIIGACVRLAMPDQGETRLAKVAGIPCVGPESGPMIGVQ